MVIGAAVTTVPLSSYFTHPDTINFLNTALIWITTCRDTLPGLFAGRPFPDLDGSLWTLRYEVLCYGFLAAASLMGPHVVRWGAVLALIGLPVDAFFPPSRAVSIGLMSNYVEYILFEFSAVFAVGVLTCWMNRQSLGRSVLATTLLLVLCWNSDPLRFIAWHFFLAFAAVYVGRYTRLDRFLPGGADISYGFYIYAWPMTQLAEAWFKHIKYGGPLSYVVALFMTIFLATASWFLIERPALALKPRIARWLDARLPVIPLEA
jgi:peptidoglycan/LPS O-acetylase OafA/YrhL